MNSLKYKRYLLIVILLSTAILFLSLFTYGCSSIGDIKNNIVSRFNKGEAEEAAVDAVEGFFSSIIDKDFEKAYSYIYILENENLSLKDFKNEFTDITEIIKIEAKWVEIKNNIAVVGIDLIDTYDGEEKIYKDIEVSLIKDAEEKWKINFWK